MNIPKDVKVGGVKYKVVYKTPIELDNGLRCYGLCDYSTHAIYLDKTIQDEQGLKQTFIHELIHAICFEGNVEMTRLGVELDTMEQITDGVGKMLCQVIQDNPKVFTKQESKKSSTKSTTK